MHTLLEKLPLYNVLMRSFALKTPSVATTIPFQGGLKILPVWVRPPLGAPSNFANTCCLMRKFLI